MHHTGLFELISQGNIFANEGMALDEIFRRLKSEGVGIEHDRSLLKYACP